MEYYEIISDPEQGRISWSNESAGWSAVARDNVFMITFDKGKFTFTRKDDVNRFYKNKLSFAIRLSQLIKRGF